MNLPLKYDTTLPSVAAAEQFWKGEEGGAVKLVTSTALRALLIAAGLAAAGERKRLVRYSIAGALAIEVFVLVTVRSQLKQNGVA